MELPLKLPPKPKAGLYIDDSNLYKRGKASGWMTDYKKLYKWVASLSSRGFRNKCNFDVEMHDEIMAELDDLDIVYIASGDSDFIRTKENILKRQKHVKFIAYENNCAWEIRTASWFISLDSIRAEVERAQYRTEKPGTRPGEVT